MIGAERKKWVSTLAESIANKFFSRGEPVVPEVIAKAYKIGYTYGQYGDYFDGLLQHVDGDFHIFINTEKHNNSKRHRFSFAHELGHYFIDEHAIALAQNLAAGHCSTTGFISERIVEREADIFAASLLMPEKRVIQEYRKSRTFSFEVIESISQAFQVSITSALYRVFFLDLHPMMIIKSRDGQQVGQPMRSSDFYHRLRSTELPEDSGAFHFFEKKEKHKTRELYLFDWFDTESTESLFERCIYQTSSNTVLSILWK